MEVKRELGAIPRVRLISTQKNLKTKGLRERRKYLSCMIKEG